MKQWRIIIDFFVYRAHCVEEVRAILPIITSTHDFHEDALKKAKIIEMTNDEVLEHTIDDSIALNSHLMNIDRELMKENQTEWDLKMPSGNRFVWVKGEK